MNEESRFYDEWFSPGADQKQSHFPLFITSVDVYKHLLFTPVALHRAIFFWWPFHVRWLRVIISIFKELFSVRWKNNNRLCSFDWTWSRCLSPQNSHFTSQKNNCGWSWWFCHRVSRLVICYQFHSVSIPTSVCCSKVGCLSFQWKMRSSTVGARREGEIVVWEIESELERETIPRIVRLAFFHSIPKTRSSRTRCYSFRQLCGLQHQFPFLISTFFPRYFFWPSCRSQNNSKINWMKIHLSQLQLNLQKHFSFHCIFCIFYSLWFH